MSTRVPILAGNWKMHMTAKEAADLAAAMDPTQMRIGAVMGAVEQAAKSAGKPADPKAIQNAAELARRLDHAGKVSARQFLARFQAQHRALNPHFYQVIFQRGLILDVNL